MTKIISGKEIAESLIETNLKPRIEKLKAQNITPKLVVIIVGNDPASEVYVRQKEKFAEKVGILGEIKKLPASTTQAQLLDLIRELNQDATIHGVMVQVPLPDHIDVQTVINTINPDKDVDGFSAINTGKLFLGQKSLESCTPKGIIRMIETAGYELSGKNISVIGRSNTVGKPVAALALNKNATVTICHSRTKDLKKSLENSDIIIVAVGIPEFLKSEMVPDNAVIIDVGIHRKPEGGLCGDVQFDTVAPKCEAISPVPGGVGPMTVFCLIENTIQAAESL